MKKIILSLSFLFLTFCYANSQSFSLTIGGLVLEDTVTVFPSTPGGSVIEFSAIVNNLTNVAVTTKFARNEIFMIDSAYSDFCWAGSCYPPIIDTSFLTQTLPAGGSSAEGDFLAHYNAKGTVGVSIIEYTLYNVINPIENLKVVVRYDTSPDGIDENILKNIWVSDLYPNPASNYVIIDYDMPAEVKEASVIIVNLLGAIVKAQKIDARNNNMKLDIFDLNGGVYFYSINVNDEIYRTKKLIIR